MGKLNCKSQNPQKAAIFKVATGVASTSKGKAQAVQIKLKKLNLKKKAKPISRDQVEALDQRLGEVRDQLSSKQSAEKKKTGDKGKIVPHPAPASPINIDQTLEDISKL